jgi:hypothetical protein
MDDISNRRDATHSRGAHLNFLDFPSEGAEQPECREAALKRIFGVILIVAVLALSACGSATADKSATSDKEEAARKVADAKPVPPPKIIIPAGTSFHVRLNEGVSASKSEPGTQFTASLADPVVVNGKTLLPQGSHVVGRVVDAKESGRVKGRATLSLVLTSVVHNGKSVPIETQTYVGVAKSTKKRDAGVIGGAAGVGAVIGAIAGGGKGAATGVAIGGAGGTGAVLATRGEDVHYPPETRLSFVLSKVAEL